MSDEGSSVFGGGQSTKDQRATVTGHGANSGHSSDSVSATDAAQVNTGVTVRGGGGANYNFEGPASAQLLDILTRADSPKKVSSSSLFDWHTVLPYAAFAAAGVVLLAYIVIRKRA